MAMLDEKQKEYIKNISCTKEEYKEQVKNDLEKDPIWTGVLYAIISVWGDKNPSSIDDLASCITENVWRLKNEIGKC